MNEIIQRISDIGIVPVIKLEDVKNALPLAKALSRGGIPCAEITFRTDVCVDAIKAITQELPDMVVGAGTVLTTGQVDEAVAAGAQFIVSPGLNSELVMGFRIAHVGINCADSEEAHKIAGTFESLFGFSQNENPSSIFAASSVEVMKKPFLGAKGHLAIAANFPERAVKYLERKGAVFNYESAVYRADGGLQAIYLQEEIGGFAVHLVKKPGK